MTPAEPVSDEKPSALQEYVLCINRDTGKTYYRADGLWWLHDPSKAQAVDQNTLELIDRHE